MGDKRRRIIAQQRHLTAMHEASHVVVGLECGRRLVRCSIVPEQNAFSGYGLAAGSTEWEPVGDGAVNVPALVKIALAGQVAEERLYEQTREECLRSDLALIYTLAWLATVSSEKFRPHARLIPLLTGIYCERPDKVPPRAKRLAEEMISAQRPKVENILERRWHDVELIAELLLKHKRITPEMIDEVGIAAGSEPPVQSAQS